jgi:TolB-like protein
MVRLELAGCFVDAAEIAAAADTGFAAMDTDALQAVAGLFAGEVLDGLAVDRSPDFDAWLGAQRRRFGALHADLLENLAARLPADSADYAKAAETWVAIAPFDQRAHLALVGGLARRGQVAAGDAHVASAAQRFQAEGLDFGQVRDGWQALRSDGPAVSASLLTPLPAMARLVESPAPMSIREAAPQRASIAVMPFSGDPSPGGGRSDLADGLTHDIITRLAKLRDLFVIARGSVFALAEQAIGPEEAGRKLNVDYVASGSVRRGPVRVTVSVELVDARTARIVWADVFEHRPEDVFIVLDEIGNSIVSSISAEIEMAERNRAMLKAPNSLNAWEAYHRGLWHMYRFTRAENEQAQHFFGTAIALDPTFARAHAGLSFTHWQNAFQRWGDRERESDLAYETAGRSLLIDDHNPASHWAMGRALWLRGHQDESLGELERCVDLSPNFALGHYALSFVHSQAGDPKLAIGSSDHSRNLSPFDPLLFGMLGARAMAHVRLGQFEEAAEWALKAAARPNAHIIILAIAAHCLALAGREEEARNFAAAIRRMNTSYSTEDFLSSFRFGPDTEALFRTGARRIGLSR